MKEEDFRAVLALHKHKNLTIAAREMFVGQPALSKQISRIEHELGVTIISRSNRGVEFTDEGEYLAERSADVIELIDEIKAKLVDISK